MSLNWWVVVGFAFILLAYAIYRQDPVFIGGQSTGAPVYIRNLMLIARGNRRRSVVP